MNDQKPVVYLDLDRTLFRTGEIARFYQEVGRLFPTFDGKKEYERDALREFYAYPTETDTHCYDMSAHLAATGLVPEDVYAAVLESDFADGRMEFNGVAELVEMLKTCAEPRILTFGLSDYQEFKVSLCPSLAGLPVITTLREKTGLLEELGEEAWLVDDRPIGYELPNNVSFIQVDLEGRDNVPLDAMWPVFDNLTDVKEFLYDQLH